MIPILYDGINNNARKVEADATFGVGVLTETVSAFVTEQRNGIYDLEMQYPVFGKMNKLIAPGMIIKAKPNRKDKVQMFRIYYVSSPIKGLMTVKAHHISYDTNKIMVTFANLGNIQGIDNCINALHTNTSYRRGFTISTDIINTESKLFTSIFKQEDVPISCSFRKAIGGMSHSFIDTFGGELHFDNHKIELLKSRGTDNNVHIVYGKNIKELNYEINNENVYDTIWGIAFNEQRSHWYRSKVYDLEGNVYNDTLINPRQLTVDLSEEIDWSDDPSPDEVFERMNAILESGINSKVIKAIAEAKDKMISIKASFYPPNETDYKEEIDLCDTVYFEFARIGVAQKVKVQEVTWNVLLDRYEKITIGTIQPKKWYQKIK